MTDKDALGLVERPLSAMNRASDEPEWKQVNNLFEQHGLASPYWRLRDELVNWLEWARYAERIEPLLTFQAQEIERLKDELVEAWRNDPHGDQP